MSNKTPAVITCKNCGNNFSGNFCNNCSQAAATSRITWKKIFDLLLYGIFHVNKGLPFTIKEMFIRPGKMVKDYLAGKRVNYFNPFLFLLIAGGLHLFLFETFEFKLITKQVTIKSIEAFSSTIAHKFFLIPSLFFLVLFTVTDFLLYKKYKLNFPELIVLNTYCVAQLGVIVILFIPILYLQQWIVMKFGIFFIVRPYIKFYLLAYLVFARVQFFWKEKNYLIILKILIQAIVIDFSYELLIAKIAYLIGNVSH